MPGLARRWLSGALLLTSTVTVVALGTPAFAGTEGTVRGEGAPGAIAGRYIVVLRSGTADSATATTEALATELGGTVRRAYTEALHGFSADLTESQARRLAASPLVAYVQQDRRVAMTGTQLAPPSWGLDRVDQLTQPLSGSYTYPNTAQGVTVYVIDTGVRLTHQDFGGRASSGYDFVDDDADASDCAGHGTHVAGTIGGTRYGVAKGVRLVSVRVLDCSGYGAYSDVIAGIEWVTRNATLPAVANMSLGGPPDEAVDQAVRTSIASGVTYALAAGNANADACGVTPARTGEAITVGATGSDDTRASFSNYGSCVDIYAPGVGITSAGAADDAASMVMSGTSMATPHVAGAAALVLADHPAYPPAQVRDALVGGAVSRILYVGQPTNESPVVVPSAPAAPVAGAPCYVRSNSTDLAIRDRRTATSAVNVSGCPGRASRSTRVEVTVVHSRRGDLTVELVSPTGSVRRLKSASRRDTAANLHAVYTVNMSARNKNGTWRLRVRDSHRGNSGYLDRWTLTL
jgi:subtilisin family serine protease